MICEVSVWSIAGIRPDVSALNLKAKKLIFGAGAFVLALISTSAAQAQCSAAGMSTPPPVFTGAAAAAVAGVSASVSSLVSSIHTANTAFLAQSTAFIGAPANPEPDQEGGGVWGRAVGGHMNSSTTATAGNISFGAPVAGTITCNTRVQEDFAGVQIGTDLARLNVNGWNLHAGSTLGYLGARTQDVTPPGLNPPPSFRDNLGAPFVGLYGAATNGGFFIDGQVRWDFYQNEVSDNNHGMSGQHFDARGIGLAGNIGYNQALGNWFIEPSAGIIWSSTHVDLVNVPGTLVYGSGAVPPWVLAVNDIQSTIGRVGVRFGTTVPTGSVVLQPYASANIMRDFQGAVTASLTSNFAAIGSPAPTLTSSVATTGFGTYSQFGLGVAAQFVNTGWVGYLRGDYRTGESLESWSLNGGLRYQFVPDATVPGRGPLIAKAPIYKAAPAPRPVYSWAGFYIGGYLGADWGSTGWTFADGSTVNPGFAGFLGGGEVGYNFQVEKWVLGVEADAGWTNAHGARSCPSGFFFNCEANIDWLSTTTARIGYAYWDRLLLYVKGGAAIGQDRADVACNTGSRPTVVPLAGCPTQSFSKTKLGWTVGWGSEFGLTPHVSVKGEIAYFNLGTDRYNIAGNPADIQRDGFISTLGLHYRFDVASMSTGLLAGN